MKKTLLTISFFVNSFFLACAQGSFGFTSTSAPNSLLKLINEAQKILNALVPFSVGLALLAFFWFLVIFIWKASANPEEQIKAKSGMFWSLIALFVMVSVWGIVIFIANTFGIQVGATMGGFKLPGEL